jgi:predicted RNA-binding protein
LPTADYELNKQFPKNYFGVEVSATTEEAYKRDSSFWQTVRIEPLTAKEIKFIQYKDSIYRVTHTKQYLDSLTERLINLPGKSCF